MQFFFSAPVRTSSNVSFCSPAHIGAAAWKTVDEAEVKAEASFTNDLGADSLDTVELIMEFEKEFGISIPDDKAEKIGTVGDAIAYIEENAK